MLTQLYVSAGGKWEWKKMLTDIQRAKDLKDLKAAATPAVGLVEAMDNMTIG